MASVARTLVFCLLLLSGAQAFCQAPSRLCPSVGSGSEVPGPACLLAKVEIGSLGDQPVFWHLYTYPTSADAQAASTRQAATAEAFGRHWLFAIADSDWRPRAGQLIAKIGPLPLKPAAAFTAEYLRSVFEPGMTAPVHVHSGPEAFFALTGDTCLETPEGAQVAKGPSNTLIIQGGPPMLLMATGSEVRRGFALILHDSSMPPTTLVDDWHAKGLCRAGAAGT
jgi:quercetin dioxygenase-like cupin family protein